MIFLSYSHKDKTVVAPMAEALRKVFGEKRIFFDQWSIQPGDSLIDKMENGLSSCSFFFFLVSKNSLSSQMVGLEWKNALIKHVKGNTSFIPVKLDDCDMPLILLQNLFINLYGDGMEFAIRQMIDVASGNNTYRPEAVVGFQNIRAYVTGTEVEAVVEFRAETYTEPQSKYLILIGNDEQEVRWAATKDPLFHSGFQQNLRLDSGEETNAILAARSEPTSPGFPFLVTISSLVDKPVLIRGAMRAKASDSFVGVPMIDHRTAPRYVLVQQR